MQTRHKEMLLKKVTAPARNLLLHSNAKRIQRKRSAKYSGNNNSHSAKSSALTAMARAKNEKLENSEKCLKVQRSKRLRKMRKSLVEEETRAAKGRIRKRGNRELREKAISGLEELLKNLHRRYKVPIDSERGRLEESKELKSSRDICN
eukprot:TRINITY_DN6082_c0_g2_i2.p1 TRINITY_DN6082_c0_g2~~TRINITY_DN6082_c0_g2_i2.p1  ORF type:complete len:149 (-),score=25.70 TRINITY_DN6082_c0_g2_i2:306-752(-)